ncbi:MAG: Zn-dependent oligopeptidase [Thermoanaerobaculia bacterium]|nr:Zn-dependent oligopeptidase [Thermoanaerobaculia bacterium]
MIESLRPSIPIAGAAELRALWSCALAEARERYARIAEMPLDAVSVASVLDEWDRISTLLEDAVGPVAILNSVHTDRAVRDAGDEILLELSSFTTDLFQDAALFERVSAVDAKTGAERQLKKDLIEAFEDSGVALPVDRRARVREITDELTTLAQEFARNVRENTTRLAFTPEECEGLPAHYLERVERDEQGKALVGFDTPDYGPFMTSARSGEARRRYYEAYHRRGTARNLEILDRIVALRLELAALYDFPSFADFVTRRNMAGSPDAVHRFLSGVEAVVDEAERSDVEELRALKIELESGDEATRLERWDVQYYTERLRERRFAIDQEALRECFPTLPTIRWTLGVTERLYGIRFVPSGVPVWHDDVMAYEVAEAADGAYVGLVYLDLFPREGKYKHAAAWPVRGVSTKAGRTPISVLVTNFDRNGLTHHELETFFHEFGHAMHGVLSRTTYNQHAGTSVQRDFVEAPSQMYEEWARRWESLRTLSDAVGDAPKLDEALVARLRDARRFGQGIRYARQLLYARYDMELAGPAPRGSLETWIEMEGRGPLGHVAGTAFPGTFGHIAEGYAAGYYGYMWAEVLALDMLSAFRDDLTDPEVGRRFRDVVLSRGGEAPAGEIVEAFLGRPVSNEAFFHELRGQRG